MLISKYTALNKTGSSAKGRAQILAYLVNDDKPTCEEPLSLETLIRTSYFAHYCQRKLVTARYNLASNGIRGFSGYDEKLNRKINAFDRYLK